MVYIYGIILGLIFVCVLGLAFYDIWASSALREDVEMWRINRRKEKVWRKTKKFIKSIK